MSSRSWKVLSTIVLFVVAALWLNHGVFVGSREYYYDPDSKTSYATQWADDESWKELQAKVFFVKRCRYLFITGISDLPARGGPFGEAASLKGVTLASGNKDSLHCLLFGD